MILQVYPALVSQAGVVSPQTGATWVTHPDQPGPDVPPVGRSLFDRLFTRAVDAGLEYQIPFPFESLISHLESAVTNQEGKAVSHVMIPIGRSLQRAAASPDYFRYPRHLISLNGESRVSGNQAGFAVQNRLFIAYQEKARQLEVISYNENAGRFEFQVVHNYDAGEEATVEYTSRPTCISCHQNGGPIFAKSPWDESNFNAGVASAIAGARPEKYASMLDAIGFDAAIMDLSTNYANYLAVTQLIWQQGCGSDLAATQSGVRCRAGFLNAMLQYRLSGELGFNARDPAWSSVEQAVAGQWAKLWPDGLLIPTADIPDVNPFDLQADDPSLDPLTPREPRDLWLQPGKPFLRGLVEQQSSALIPADDRRLDAKLLALSEGKNDLIELLEVDCALSLTARDGTSWQLGLNCIDPGALRLDLDLTFDGSVVGNSIIRLIRLSSGEIAWNTGFLNPVLRVSGNSASISSGLVNTKTGLSARLTSGNRLHRIQLDWDPQQLDAGDITTTARVTLWMARDYRFIEQAIHKLSGDTLAGRTDALATLPFRRDAVMSGIYRYLGVEELDW
jgi:hypothetical protein